MAPNGDLFLSDARMGLIRRFDTRSFDQPAAPRQPGPIYLSDLLPGHRPAFTSPADVAIAANGDLYVADAREPSHLPHRAGERQDHHGRGIGVGGFDGDGRQATQAALHAPNAVSVARNGDLYIADTLNHRIRVWPRRQA